MSKGRRVPQGTKEYSELQRARAEVKKLKVQLARRTQQLKRCSSFEEYRELITQQHQEDLAAHGKRRNIDPKKQWACWNCQENGSEEAGYLVIVPIFRRDGAFYYRRCSNSECGKRTKLQRLKEDMKGIKEEID